VKSTNQHKNRNLNMNFVLPVGLILTLLMVGSVSSFAADIYVQKGGTKTSGKSVAGDWSNGNCYSGPVAGFAAMSAGDTMTIDDGNYPDRIYQNGNLPPSGTGKTAMTTIRARNIPCQDGYSCSSPLKVNFGTEGNTSTGLFIDGPGGGTRQFIKFQGIRFLIANITYTGWEHLYFKQCAFEGTTSGNSAALALVSQYALVEDSVFYGMGRYKFLLGGTSQFGVCRRCIARHDYANRNDEATMPIAVFNSYAIPDTAYLNSIAIDGDSPAFWTNIPTEFGGAFYSTNGSVRTVNRGSIAINTAMAGIGYGVNSVNADNIVTDFAAIKTASGIGMAYGTTNRATFFNMGTNNFTYRSPEQITHLTFKNMGLESWGTTNQHVATNVVMKNIQEYGVRQGYGAPLASYVDIYGANSGMYNTASPPANMITTDPSAHGLLYPVRIEGGSSLSTAGTGGGQMGANILKRVGHDGDFWGDSGWDTEQSENLWPWPYEDWVKAELASMPATINGQAMPSPTRGVASLTAKGLDGTSPLTLTRYVWESLGNQIPDSIYISIPDITQPVVTAFTLPTSATEQTVSISSFTAYDNIGVTGYMISESSTPPTAGAAEWLATAPTIYTFAGTGARTAYAWAKDGAGNVSAAKSASVTIAADLVSPTVAITSPTAGSSVSGTVTVNISASDNVGVTKVELYLNGTIYASYSNAPYSIDWNTALMANGPCTMTAKAYDVAGNVGQSTVVVVTINNPLPDTTAPSVTSFTLSGAATALTVQITAFSATDNVAVTGYLVTESPIVPAASGTGWSSIAPASFTFAGSGTRIAYAWVKDSAGNVSAGVNATVTIILPQGTGNTYYLSPTGNNTNSCSQTLPCRELSKALTMAQAGDTILLADGTYTGTDVTKVGTAQSPITIKAQGSNVVISARSNVRGNLYLNNCSYVVVDGIKTSGGTGTLAAGIAVRFSDHVTIKNSTSYNNNMWGIFASNSPNLIIENNETYGQITQHGIYVADATASHDQPIIRNNRSHDNALQGLQLNADNGGTGYFTGALIENNIVYNNGSNGLNMDGVQDSVIRNNLFYNNHGSGITMFQFDAVTGPKGNQVYNNTIDMASDSKWAIRHTSSVGVSIIRNNILYNRNNAHGGISTNSQTDVNNTDSDYNIFIGSTRAVTPDDDTTFYTLTQWQSSGKDVHSFTATATPLFTNLTGANYSLAAGSLAIDKGQTLASVTTDISSNPRPQGAGYDIGAYEAPSAVDTTLPIVSAFAMPTTATSLTVVVTTFIASDNLGVTGYMITESATAPAAGATGWTASAPTSFTFSAAGSKTAYAWSKDAAGNVSASRSATVSIALPDTTAPVVSLTAPGNSSKVNGTVTITASASDNVGVSNVEFYLNGALLSTSNVAPYTYNWNTTSVANGIYTLTAKGYDNAGNIGQSSNVSVTVLNDTTPPTVSIEVRKASSGVNGVLAVTATASDNVGVSKVEFYVNGALASTATIEPYIYNWDSATVATGSYTLVAKAYDATGNLGQSGTIRLSKPNVQFR
jgi:hypothetical protein